MIIKKAQPRLYILSDKIEWTNVEVLDYDPALAKAIEAEMSRFEELQEYLAALYIPLRQTGAADVSGVEAPQWLLDQVSKRKSTSTSKKKASSSSTKKKRSSSGSRSKRTSTSAKAAGTGDA